MAVEPVIVTDGGLDLISPRQRTAPGALIDCENFERANRVGYQKIQGIRSYSGGCVFDVIDPMVLWQYNRVSLAEIYGNLVYQALLGGKVIWGDGGYFDSRTSTLSEQDGRGQVSYSYSDIGTPSDFAVAVVGIEGRIFTPGDVINAVDIPATNTVTADQSFSEIGRISEIWNAFIPGLGSLNTYGMLAKIGGEFDKTNSSFVYASGRTAGGVNVPASMLGWTCGGFYWKDRLHVVADLEAWSFTLGNEEPSAGSTLRLFVTGTHPSGTYQQGVVDEVVVTSGSWAGGDAAGVIYLTSVPNRTNSLLSVISPTQCRNQSTGVTDPITLGSRIRSDKAALWRDTGPYPTVSGVTSTRGWERCNLGHEVRFNLGENKFKVISRTNRDESLNSNYVSVPSISSWADPTVANGPAWTNPNNVLALDGTNASYSTSGATESDSIEVYDFSSITVPDNAIIVGIEVRITRRNAASFNAVRDSYVGLIGVAEGGQNKASGTLWGTSLTSVTYGGPRDTWGVSLTPSIVNSGSLGIRFRYRQTPRTGATYTTEVDSIQMRVHYKDPTSRVVIRSRTTPSQSITTITRSGSVATATKVGHGYNNGESVTIAGAVETEYNGTFTIYNVSANTFDYDIVGTPATPASGTITAQLIGVDVATGKAIWYHKDKGQWGGSTKAEGILTVYELSNPEAVLSGMEIRDDTGGSGALNAYTSSGAVKISLPSSLALDSNGSKYRFHITNFYGNQDSEQVFFVSGSDFGCSWDGSRLIRIRTGLDPNLDKPRHVARHIDQLAFGYNSGSVTLSDQGYPESFAGRIDGSSPPSEDPFTFPGFIPSATNNPTGEPVYGLAETTNRTLIVGCRGSIRSIIGGGFNISLETSSSESGMLEYTLKVMNGQILFINHRGFQSTASMNSNVALSEYISPFLIPRIQATNGALGQLSGIECVELVRHKNQYRIYFRDRRVATISLTERGPMCTFQRLPFVPKWTATGTTISGKDRIFCGTYAPGSVTTNNDLLLDAYIDDIRSITPGSNTYASYGPNIYPGVYVYEMDVGSTWDDRLPINAYATVNVGHLGTEVLLKHFDRLLLSGVCHGFANFGVQYAINYGDVETSVTNVNAGTATGSPLLAFGEQAFSREVSIRRDGYALSVKLVSNGSNAYGNATLLAQTAPYYIRPFTVQALTVLTENQKIRRA